MEKNFANLIEIDKNEVLRYLEYNGQYIDEKLEYLKSKGHIGVFVSRLIPVRLYNRRVYKNN